MSDILIDSHDISVDRKLLWEEPRVRDLYSNLVAVAANREEIMLSFGVHDGTSGAASGAKAEFTNMIILSPFTAKRLLIALNDVLGRSQPEAPSESVSSPVKYDERIGLSSLHPLPVAAEPHDEQANLLLQMVDTLGVQCGIERSFKISQGRLFDNRLLLGLKKSTVPGNEQEKIIGVCRGIGMPDDFVRDFERGLPEANIILFAFEDDGLGKYIYKAYLEFGDRIGRSVMQNPANPSPVTLFRGFKWDVLNSTRSSVAKYTCFPGFSTSRILNQVSKVFYHDRHRTALDIVKGFVYPVVQKNVPEDILYLEVEEDNNPRHSFDINCYVANLTMEEVYPNLQEMFRYYSIPEARLNALFEPVKSQIFGHLSGGIGRDGGDFMTVYYGVKGSTVR